MRILLTGGTGLIGRALTRALLERGDDVVCVTRDRKRALSRLLRRVEIVEADPTRPGPWQLAVADCDAVVNLAGEPVTAGRWTSGRKRRIRDSRLLTSRHVAEAVGGSERTRVVVSASAVGYYGDGGREPLFEERGPGGGFLGRLAHEWEGAILPAESAGKRVVRLRIGVVLSRDGGALPRLLLPYRLFVGGPLGNGQAYFPWIHLHDLVRAVLFCLDDAELRGPVNAVAPDPPTQREFARVLGRVLGRPAALPVPAPVLRLVLGEMAEPILASVRAVPKALRARGFSFAYRDLEPALRDLLG